MADDARSQENQNQATQRELIEQARQEPTIADALAAYETIRPYLPRQPSASRPQVRYASGGNS